MFHVIILSAGSLLGQNILDVLETRRGNLTITGADASCDNSRVFRCDAVYRCPLVGSDDFEPFILSLIEKEKPDLVLPGRDHDALFLARLIEKYPALTPIVCTGSSEALELMNDKALSYLFAREKSLPFAESFIMEKQTLEEVMKWADKTGFPIFAKPRQGFGSLGCKFVLDADQLKELFESSASDYLLQELLDFNHEKQQYILSFQQGIKSGVPIFSHLPDRYQYAGQTMILPDGSLAEVFTSVNLMIVGRCERTERYVDPELTAVVKQFALAMSEKGWRGFFNIQCKKTERGFVAHEMNGRMTGTTSARRLMGYDEFALLLRYFKGMALESAGPEDSACTGYVFRSLTDYFVSYDAVQKFTEEGFWRRVK